MNTILCITVGEKKAGTKKFFFMIFIDEKKTEIDFIKCRAENSILNSGKVCFVLFYFFSKLPRIDSFTAESCDKTTTTCECGYSKTKTISQRDSHIWYDIDKKICSVFF